MKSSSIGTKKNICAIIIVIYSVFLIYILFFGHSREDSSLSFSERLDTAVNLTPFHTVDSYISAVKNGRMAVSVAARNLLGNLVLFLPMGYLLPQLFTKLRGFFGSVSATAMLIVGAELIQLITGRGRFDIDDIILNLTGAVIGFLVFKIMCKGVPH